MNFLLIGQQRILFQDASHLHPPIDNELMRFFWGSKSATSLLEKWAADNLWYSQDQGTPGDGEDGRGPRGATGGSCGGAVGI